MPRAGDASSHDAVVVATALVGAAVAYVDLFGSGVPAFGDATLFAYGAVLAFVAAAGVVVRARVRRWLAHAPWRRWPEAVIGAGAVALVCSVVAHVLGEGSALGLVATVLGSAAIAYAAVRARA